MQNKNTSFFFKTVFTTIIMLFGFSFGYAVQSDGQAVGSRMEKTATFQKSVFPTTVSDDQSSQLPEIVFELEECGTDDEVKEKSVDKYCDASLLFQEAKLSDKLSPKAFAYFISSAETKSPVHLYILYCSRKHFLS